MTEAEVNNSSKYRGLWVSSQTDMVGLLSPRSLNSARQVSLGRNPLGAVSAEFHENTGTAAFAADAVSVSVKRFEASTGGAFVVNEFNHITLSVVGHRSSCFESVPYHEPFTNASKVPGAMITKRPVEAKWTTFIATEDGVRWSKVAMMSNSNPSSRFSTSKSTSTDVHGWAPMSSGDATNKAGH